MKPLAIGFSTWSLNIPEAKFGETLRTIKDDLQLSVIQIGAFGQLELTEKIRDEWLKAIRDHDMEVSATCVAFVGEDYSTIATARATVGFYDPEHLEVRLQHLQNMVELTSALGVNILTTHIGYIPHEASDSGFQHMLEVTRRAADMLGERDIILGVEVGGLEPAEDILAFMHAAGRENLKINFDPANVLRGGVGDPLQALDVLQSEVAHVHCKDATPSPTEGQWGGDVPLGQGEVDLEGFVQKLKAIGYSGPLIIEGEGDHNKLDDFRSDVKVLQALV